jgi:hypothetical protein
LFTISLRTGWNASIFVVGLTACEASTREGENFLKNQLQNVMIRVPKHAHKEKKSGCMQCDRR